MNKTFYAKFVAYSIKHISRDFKIKKNILSALFKTYGHEAFPASKSDVQSLAIAISKEFPNSSKALKRAILTHYSYLVFFDIEKLKYPNVKTIALSNLVYAAWDKRHTCIICGNMENEGTLMLCDDCDHGYHVKCLNLAEVPRGDWFCPCCTTTPKVKVEVESAKDQFELSERFYYGHGVQKNLEETIRYAKLSAAQGYAPAQFVLGQYYFHAVGVNIDIDEAIRLYTLSASQGNIDAMYSLGECYLFGVGINKNVGKALDLFKLCVLKGSIEAIGTLYHMYDIMYCKEDHTLFFVKWIDGSKAWETREFMLNLEHPSSLDKVNSIPTLPLIVERKRKLETI